MQIDQLPNDAYMLLSVINTKLRDYYADFETLCDEMQVDCEDITEKLRDIDYEYDATTNQFV